MDNELKRKFSVLDNFFQTHERPHILPKNHPHFGKSRKIHAWWQWGSEGHSESDGHGLASHHNAIAGPCGEVNVVRVAGHTAIPSLNVVGHVPSHRVDALAGAVGAWRRFMWRQHLLITAKSLELFNTQGWARGDTQWLGLCKPCTGDHHSRYAATHLYYYPHMTAVCAALYF